MLELMEYFLLMMMMIDWSHSTSTRRHLCHPGTYVHTTRNKKNLCQSCPDGTFMSDSLHTHTTCYNCTQIQDQNLEVLKTECNKTHDAEILCTSGYYRRRVNTGVEKCEKCYECIQQHEHLTLPCQDYHDTVCCGHTNYDAVSNKDGIYECKERPILCDPGQFLNPETEECTPCPPGTFMSEVQHNKTACRHCKTVSDLGAHETILQACTSTQQANIGCEDGYFRNSSGNLWDEVQCLPCQKCEYQGRECDMYHDTVCCDYPDMTVVETASGPRCAAQERTGFMLTQPSTQDESFTKKTSPANVMLICGEDQYLYCSPGSDSLTCLPCGRGTYQNESNHTWTECKKCSDVEGQATFPPACDLTEGSWFTNQTTVMLLVKSFVAGIVITIIAMCIYKKGLPRLLNGYHALKKRSNSGASSNSSKECEDDAIVAESL